MFKFDMATDDTVGTADLPSLWNQRVRRNLWLHWDGNNNLVDERNKSAAIGAGATPSSLDLAALERVEDWILDLKPPAYPVAIASMRRGRRAAAAAYAAGMRDVSRHRRREVGQVTQLARDRHRPRASRARSRRSLVAQMNTLGEGYPWRFSHFRKTDGYANMPLDGMWLRAPYLHNGSVPTLRALLFRRDPTGRVLSRVRRLRLGRCRLRDHRARCASVRACASIPSQGQHATPATSTARNCTPDQREDLLEYLKTPVRQ